MHYFWIPNKIVENVRALLIALHYPNTVYLQNNQGFVHMMQTRQRFGIFYVGDLFVVKIHSRREVDVYISKGTK